MGVACRCMVVAIFGVAFRLCVSQRVFCVCLFFMSSAKLTDNYSCHTRTLTNAAHHKHECRVRLTDSVLHSMYMAYAGVWGVAYVLPSKLHENGTIFARSVD